MLLFPGLKSIRHPRDWAITGFIVISALGCAFHFVYAWTNESPFIAPFVPVNESVWEHLKLGLWGTLLFSVPEYLLSPARRKNYFFARFMGILALSLSIVIIFYTYTSFADHPILAIDISIFFFGVLLGQITFSQVLDHRSMQQSNFMGIISILILCILFGLFTYFPPHLGIFLDHTTHTFGIL
jgi:hypothetical protein